MYGLINIAIAQLITREGGTPAWERAAHELDIQGQFIAMQQYPDELTGRLVGWFAREAGIDTDAVLERVGEFWVRFAHERYGEMVDQLGRPLSAALQNLDLLHSRVGLSFPNLKAPSFRCTDVREDGLTLHYYSSRPGLAPMVIGLVKGLGDVLGTPDVEIALLRGREQGADHDTFAVRYAPPGRTRA